MASISAEDFCAAVYCAYAAHDALPPDPRPRIAFVAESTDQATKQLLAIVFDGVADLRWTPALAAGQPPYAAGNRLELSVVELDGQPAAWQVRLNLWYTHDVEFGCERITLNGAEVVGEGHFVQDWLPARRPVVPAYEQGAA